MKEDKPTIYNCLVSNVVYSLEETKKNITYGYTVIGNKLLKYIFDSDGIDLKGCLINDDINVNLTNEIKELILPLEHPYLKNNTILSDIMKICSNSALKLLNLVFHTINEPTNIYQSFVIDGPFQVNSSDNTIEILGNRHPVKNDILSLGQEYIFKGFTQDKCNVDYISSFLGTNKEFIFGNSNNYLPTIIEDISTIIVDNKIDLYTSKPGNPTITLNESEYFYPSFMLVGLFAGVSTILASYIIHEIYKDHIIRNQHTASICNNEEEIVSANLVGENNIEN